MPVSPILGDWGRTLVNVDGTATKVYFRAGLRDTCTQDPL